MIDEIIAYVMDRGFSIKQAEEHIQELIKRDELENFHKNMYLD